MSWDDAAAYVAWLSRETGEAYRLPGESEWEYAARAATATKWHFGNEESGLCRYGNHADASSGWSWRNQSCSDGVGQGTAPVGRYGANGFGLHDVHGNVWEWTLDCRNDGYAGAPSDGSAWGRGDCAWRALRGGSWGSGPGLLRSAVRYWNTSGIRSDVNGFRVARTLTP